MNDLRILKLYVDDHDRLCTYTRSGKLVYLALEGTRLIPTPGPEEEPGAGEGRTLWDRLMNE